MNAEVMNREMLIAACLTQLGKASVEHPAGHKGKLAARYIIRSNNDERVGLMFEKSGKTKPYLWMARPHARDLLEADTEFRVYLPSSLYQEAEPGGKRPYGRRAALKSMRDLANADLILDRVGQMDLIT